MISCEKEISTQGEGENSEKQNQNFGGRRAKRGVNEKKEQSGKRAAGEPKCYGQRSASEKRHALTFECLFSSTAAQPASTAHTDGRLSAAASLLKNDMFSDT